MLDAYRERLLEHVEPHDLVSLVVGRIREVTHGRLPPIEVVAEGFADVTTFHRAFKRWTGMTPSAYRRGGRARALAVPSR